MYNSKGFLVPPLLFAPLIGIEKICKSDAVAIHQRPRETVTCTVYQPVTFAGDTGTLSPGYLK